MDWFKVINDLKHHGMSCEQQAREVEVTRKTIENWASRYTEPPYSKGIQLLIVHRSVVGSTS